MKLLRLVKVFPIVGEILENIQNETNTPKGKFDAKNIEGIIRAVAWVLILILILTNKITPEDAENLSF